jgi:hypothetical protein
MPAALWGRSNHEGCRDRVVNFPHLAKNSEIWGTQLCCREAIPLVVFPVLIEAFIVGWQVGQDDSPKLKHVGRAQLLVQHFAVC